MSDYAKLEVWKKAHAMTLRLYTVTERFPRTELFTLASQIRRAGVLDRSEPRRRLW